MGDHLPGEESLVGVESYYRYPHHCGREHTPLLRPGTITENGVDLDCVIGLLTTGDQGEVDMGVEPEVEGIKYCPGLEVGLPSYIFRGYKAHCSKICPDRIRYDVRNVAQEAAHTPQLGTVHTTESTGVHPCEHTTDLLKVGGVTTSTNLENSADIGNSVKYEQNIPIVAQETAHTPRLGIFIMYESISVQSLEHTADLRKVGGVTKNITLEKSPSILVEGRMEKFCDIGSMICQWEEMEGEGLESGREERERRKGRRVSRRISELTRSCEEGGGGKSLVT
jgi:hypothetical protein